MVRSAPVVAHQAKRGWKVPLPLTAGAARRKQTQRGGGRRRHRPPRKPATSKRKGWRKAAGARSAPAAARRNHTQREGGRRRHRPPRRSATSLREGWWKPAAARSAPAAVSCQVTKCGGGAAPPLAAAAVRQKIRQREGRQWRHQPPRSGGQTRHPGLKRLRNGARARCQGPCAWRQAGPRAIRQR